MARRHAADGPIDPFGAGNPRFRKAGFRRPIFLLGIVPVLAIALVVNYLPTATSKAATAAAAHTRWTPGDNVNNVFDSSGCHVSQGGSFTARDEDAALNILEC